MEPTQAVSDANGLSHRRRQRWLLQCGAAILAGAILRLWFILAFAHVTGDTLVYGDIALNWIQHGVYGLSQTVRGLAVPPRPTLIRLPGYPLFLAFCFKLFGTGRYAAVLFLQAALDLVTCGLVAGTAQKIFGDKAALPALWLGALCPFTAIYVAFPLTETLTLLCIAQAAYGLCRWQNAGAGLNGWIGVIGAALAYAVLLRPEQGMLAACVIPAMIWIERRRVPLLTRALQPAMAVALLTLLPLVPWTIRNERTFHLFQPLAPRYANDPGERNPYGFQRWYRTWAIDYASTETIYWNYEGDEIHIGDLPRRAFDSAAQYDATASLFDEYNERTTSTPEIDARFNAIATERIHAHPLRSYIALPAARVFNMIFRPRLEAFPLPLDWWSFREHPRTSLIASVLGLLNLGYVSLALMAFAKRQRLAPNYDAKAPILWSMAATIIMRCILLLTLDNSETRYTLEFFPVLILFAAGWLGSRRTTFRTPSPAPA